MKLTPHRLVKDLRDDDPSNPYIDGKDTDLSNDRVFEEVALSIKKCYYIEEIDLQNCGISPKAALDLEGI